MNIIDEAWNGTLTANSLKSHLGSTLDTNCSGTDPKCSGTDPKCSGADHKCSSADPRCSGADLKYSLTLLAAACSSGRIDVVDLATTLNANRSGAAPRCGGADPKCSGAALKYSLTPLAAACSSGHIDVVNLLLANGANPNAPSHGGRTPLHYVTSSPSGLAANRCSIVSALLDAGANIDARSSAIDDEFTPLMNALIKIRDKKVVNLLVDRGASLTAKNGRGQTAEMMAKDTDMERELRPAAERNSGLETIVEEIVRVVMLILAYANSDVIKGVVNDFVHEISGRPPPQGNSDMITIVKAIVGVVMRIITYTDSDIIKVTVHDVAKKIRDAILVDEFKQSTEKYVKETKLTKFFPPGDPFLQTVAEKGAKLRDDPNTDLGKPEHMERLTRLALYQPVIYCDDSGSMEGVRYETQVKLVTRIADIATKIVPDGHGVELRFINTSPSPRFSNLSSAEIEAAMAGVELLYDTKIGTSLESKILKPLVYDVLETGQLKQPLLVCTFTDGSPSRGDRSLKDVIKECGDTLVKANYERKAVMFSVSQIGSDEEAADFLEDLRGDPEIKEVLYCTTDELDSKYEDLEKNEKELDVWLLEMLTNPLMDRVD